MWMEIHYTTRWVCDLLVLTTRMEGKVKKDKMKDAVARVSQWRWVIIDEIGMVSGSFLAEWDMHIRQIMTDVTTQDHRPTRRDGR